MDQGCHIHTRRHDGNTWKTNDTQFWKAHDTRSCDQRGNLPHITNKNQRLIMVISCSKSAFYCNFTATHRYTLPVNAAFNFAAAFFSNSKLT